MFNPRFNLITFDMIGLRKVNFEILKVII
jgi:hypothetical protein